MAAQSASDNAIESISTVIDVGIVIDGSIKVDSGKALLIKGQFTGSIESNGVVVIGEGAICTGSLTARQLRVAGTIRKSDKGPSNMVVAKEALFVESSGVVDTDVISYGALELQYGARVAGTMSPISGTEAPKQEQRLQAVPRQETTAPAAASVSDANSHQASAAPSPVSQASRAATVTPIPESSGVVRPDPSLSPSVPRYLMNVGDSGTGERVAQRASSGI